MCHSAFFDAAASSWRIVCPARARMASPRPRSFLVSLTRGSGHYKAVLVTREPPCAPWDRRHTLTLAWAAAPGGVPAPTSPGALVFRSATRSRGSPSREYFALFMESSGRESCQALVPFQSCPFSITAPRRRDTRDPNARGGHVAERLASGSSPPPPALRPAEGARTTGAISASSRAATRRRCLHRTRRSASPPRDRALSLSKTP